MSDLSQKAREVLATMPVEALDTEEGLGHEAFLITLAEGPRETEQSPSIQKENPTPPKCSSLPSPSPFPEAEECTTHPDSEVEMDPVYDNVFQCKRCGCFL